MIRVPDPFDSRYRDLRLLGRGGFGEVYRAWDVQMERDVALKVLRGDLAADPVWQRRFKFEATAASKLSHRNITMVFDRGDFDGLLYLAMEFVEGETLAQLIGRRAPLSDSERLDLLEQLCDGLNYAHHRNLIHRDVKPVNLMVREEVEHGRHVRILKILDFGIAKNVDPACTSTSGQLMFTPEYVSPEQIRGLELDRRSDIFAVGAVAYELLTFEKAFKVTSSSPFTLLEEVKQKIGERPHLQLSAVRPELDPALAIVVDRALAKRPEDRFQDLSAMRREISVIRERLQAQEAIDSAVTTRAVGSVSDQAATSLRKGDSAAADSETSFAAMKDNARPSRWSIHAGVIAAVFLVAAAAAGVFHYLASFPSEAPQVAPSPPGIAPGSERSKESKNDDSAPQQRELTSQDVHPADRDKKATDDTEISRQLRLVVANATRHARAGELREALAKIESGLLIRADHAELNALLQEMFRDALRESTAEREAAVRRGARNAAAPEFDRAANLEEEAATLRRSGRTPEAVRRLWLARETFASAKAAADPPLPNTPGRTQNEQPEKLRSNEGAVPDRTTPREGTPRSPVGRTEAKDPPAVPLVSPEKPPDALPTETDSIRQVIREYEAAYRSMDVSALEQVVAVSPLEAERLREAFAEAKIYDLQVNIREIELSPDGRKASVRASVVHLITPKVGGQSFKNVGSATFELAFSDSRWKIVDVQNR